MRSSSSIRLSKAARAPRMRRVSAKKTFTTLSPGNMFTMALTFRNLGSLSPVSCRYSVFPGMICGPRGAEP